MFTADEKEYLTEQLCDLLEQLDDQVAIITVHAEESGLNPMELRLKDGSWVMTPILAAKAQTMNALVILNSEVVSE